MPSHVMATQGQTQTPTYQTDIHPHTSNAIPTANKTVRDDVSNVKFYGPEMA